MTLLIPSLTTLQNQLGADAQNLGISVLDLNKASRAKSIIKGIFQTPTSDMLDALRARPQLVLTNVDMLADPTIQVWWFWAKLNVFQLPQVQ